jgi:hypothetical protein
VGALVALCASCHGQRDAPRASLKGGGSFLCWRQVHPVKGCLCQK